MKGIRSIRAFLALLFVCSMAVCGIHAQSLTTGDVTGTVTDASGAVVPNANVILRSEAQGNTQETTTNSNGLYRFSLLAPGKYSVTAKASGFETVVLQTSIARRQRVHCGRDA